LGNHDYLGNASAQIEYTKHSKRWILPNYNYSVNINTNNGDTNLIHMLMIDTILLCGNNGYDWNQKYLNWDQLDSKEKIKSINYLNDIENHLEAVSKQNFSYIVSLIH
jgi:tartrate-resistant acid phosphatase type 5